MVYSDVRSCATNIIYNPPVGFALFYMKGVAPQGITIQNIYRGIIPFVILQVIAVAIVFNFPKIVTWLPEVAYGP